MAPGPISRNYYVTQEKFDKLARQVEKQSEALVVLAEVMKILASRIYDGDSDESAEQEVYERTLKMVNSWE